MTTSRNHTNECGAFIACGAAGITINHDPDEPTSIDRIVAAIKSLARRDARDASSGRVKGERPTRRPAAAQAHML